MYSCREQCVHLLRRCVSFFWGVSWKGICCIVFLVIGFLPWDNEVSWDRGGVRPIGIDRNVCFLRWWFLLSRWWRRLLFSRVFVLWIFLWSNIFVVSVCLWGFLWRRLFWIYLRVDVEMFWVVRDRRQLSLFFSFVLGVVVSFTPKWVHLIGSCRIDFRRWGYVFRWYPKFFWTSCIRTK